MYSRIRQLQDSSSGVRCAGHVALMGEMTKNEKPQGKILLSRPLSYCRSGLCY